MISRVPSFRFSARGFSQRLTNKFSTTTKITHQKNSFQESTNQSFQEYFNDYPFELSEPYLKFQRDNMEEKILPKIARNRYFEIGTGTGATVATVGSQFDHVMCAEPNPLYIDACKERLQSLEEDSRPKTIRFIPKMIQEFDPRLDLTEQEQRDGFDLIVCSHLFYHIHPEEWSTTLDSIQSVMAKKRKSAVVISMRADKGVYYDAFTKHAMRGNGEKLIAPLTQYFGQTDLKTTLWEEMARFEMSESAALNFVLWRWKVSSIVPVKFVANGGDDVWGEQEEIARRVVSESGRYLGRKDENGEEMIEMFYPVVHVVASNFDVERD